ncbi:MAG: HisA/HisF-related TIM barrel protein [Clostridiales bacterium]
MKKRLIFTLLYYEDFFVLSRNFRLQKVGDIRWIEDYYNFKQIAFSIDELVILNINRDEKHISKFCDVVSKLIHNVFVPVAVGGGINSMEYAEMLFMSGADKIIVNTAVHERGDLVKQLIQKYGAQSIIASIDFDVENGKPQIFTHNGTIKVDVAFRDYLKYIADLGVGEVYINSIRKDGTGQGYDLEILSEFLPIVKLPVIMAGGAGNSKHLIEAINNQSVDAVATANLFNFIGRALPNSRNEMLDAGINLARFHNNFSGQ